MKTLFALIKPVVTEKATAHSAKLKYSFWVNRKATKIDIKMAIRDAYGVEVDTVRTMNTPAKKKIMRRLVINKRPPMKKAIITLKGGKKLDVTKMGKETAKK